MLKASFFDVDGTLVKGLMIFEFPKHLNERGLFDRDVFARIQELFKEFKKGRIGYREGALIAPAMYAKGLAGAEEYVIRKEARKFTEEYVKAFSHNYTLGITKLMKGYGKTFGISGSPKEILDVIKEIFGFDIAYGTETEIKDGVFTGAVRTNMVITESKEKAMSLITDVEGIDLKGSFGFGDTVQDMAILSSVGKPIALSPTKELMEVVKANGWKYFDSSMDVVEEVRKLL
jgi:HAD superfamily hydrolase (TIGR01490 family)